MTRLGDPVVVASTPHVANPATTVERLVVVDILRGLAVCAMILVHFHQRVRLEIPGPEDLIGWFVWVGVEEKAWGTFAFLFGVGFAVLLRRWEGRGVPVTALYLRRLAGLAIFGVITELCFGLQILLDYAIWGVPLLFIRKWSTRALLIAAAIAVVAQPLMVFAMQMKLLARPTEVPPLLEAIAAAEKHGTYGQLFDARLTWFLFKLTWWRAHLPDVNLVLFIIGLLAVRHGVFDAPSQHKRMIKGWMLCGAASWAAYWLVLQHYRWPLGTGFGLVQEQWLCFTYIGAVVLLLADRPDRQARLTPFANVGRMALTNYMLQAAVIDFVRCNYGLRAALRPSLYAIAAVVLSAVLAWFSGLWLARYRFGPLEWIWRSFTYGGLQPLRRAAQ